MAWLIRSYDDEVPPQLCDNLRKFMDDDNGDPSCGREVETAGGRRCRKFMYNSDSADTLNLEAEVKDVIQKLFVDKYCGGKADVHRCQRLEPPAVQKYCADTKDHLGLHADNWNSLSANRLISVVLYLNDVHAGGETHFPDYDISVRPKKGRIVFFPSFFTHMHEAKPVAEGEKYVVVTWLCSDSTPNDKLYLTMPMDIRRPVLPMGPRELFSFFMSGMLAHLVSSLKRAMARVRG